jgi:hypothetical protein
MCDEAILDRARRVFLLTMYSDIRIHDKYIQEVLRCQRHMSHIVHDKCHVGETFHNTALIMGGNRADLDAR